MFTKTYLQLLTGLLLVVLVAFLACSKAEQEVQTSEVASTEETATEMEKAVWNKVCPICGDEVDTSVETVAYKGKVYGFGCPACPERFSKEPEKFVKNLSADGTEFIGS